MSLVASSIALLGFSVLAQTGAVQFDPDKVRIRKEPDCVCPAAPESDPIVIDAIVVDAELTLAPDGLSANDRRATVFDIIRASEDDIEGRVRVWHYASRAQCGVQFDYGKQYEIAVRRLSDDELETDACLIDQTGAF